MSIRKEPVINLYKLADAMLRPFDQFIKTYEEEFELTYAAAFAREKTNLDEYEAGKNAYGAAFVNFKDLSGFTLLHYAVARGRLDIVEFLLSEGANPAIKNKQGQTALNLATNKYAIDQNNEELDPTDLYLQKDVSGIIATLIYGPTLQVLPSTPVAEQAEIQLTTAALT